MSAVSLRRELDRPSVLVLLACLNGERWITRQLESILAQDDVRLQVIVRDDGSSDRTLELVARLAVDRRISVSPRSEPTGSAAQNFLTLIRDYSAEGFDYIAFADQDDVWFPDKLSRACRLLQSADSAGYSSATIATWEDGRSALLRQATVTTPADFLFEGAGQGCTFVLRADFYAEARGLVTLHRSLTQAIHYHDWLVYALARTLGRKWTFDPAPSVRYRQHGANDTGARGRLAGVAKRLNLIRQRWYSGQLVAIASVCTAAGANPVVEAWRSILLAKKGWKRRLRVAWFCLRNGRRRRRDNIVLVAAALSGWI